MREASVTPKSLERFQDDIDESQRRDAKRHGTDVIQGDIELQSFVAEVIRYRAADCCDEVLPQMIARLTLRALKKQDDETSEDHHRAPIVDSLHRVDPPLLDALGGYTSSSIRAYYHRVGVDSAVRNESSLAVVALSNEIAMQ